MDKKPKLNSSLIGQRLVEAGYLTKEQLKEALHTQKETAFLLGEVCIFKGWLTYKQLQECLPPLRTKLGHRLLADKHVTIEQLLLALLEQRVTGQKLGDILVERGWVARMIIEQAEQERPNHSSYLASTD